MAYQQQNTWWLSGPKNPQGGGCGGACGESGMGGLGQAGSTGICADGTPSSVVATQGSCNDGSLPICANGQVWAGYCTPTPGVLGTQCPAGATSCTGTGESVAVVVNRPVILLGDFRLGNIPVFDSNMSPSDLNFYHSTYYSAVAIICVAYAVTSILGNRRKIKIQNRRNRL